MAKILHHGAVTGVTGSCHQLFDGAGRSLLIDCGMFQGAEASASTAIDFSLTDIQALLITHCHIDHVGRLPQLLAAGFDKPIYTSEATARLLPLVIEDALKIGVTRDKALIESVLRFLESLIIPVPYNQRFNIPGTAFRCCFRRAGHILGSAYVECETDDEMVVFSGDLGAPHSPLLADPESPVKADCLVLESTYGDKLHENRKARQHRLQSVIEHCLEDAGTVLIPAFSIGRTQELLYEIEDIIHKAGGDWSQLDIVVDSPLAARFTEHYSSLKKLWDAEARERVDSGRHPLSFEQLITIDSHSDHQKLVNYLKQSGRPAIVIAASGMCAGGRITNYLKALLNDSRTDVLFVGYQAEGTPGRDIQKYGPRGGYVYLEGERVDIRAGVHTISGYSAHADQQDLISFVMGMREKPSEIRIVHGDRDAKRALCKELVSLLPGCRVWVPEG